MSGKKITSLRSAYLLFTCVFLISLSGCQRDDICPPSEQGTPRLQIGFFDFTDPTTPKPPVNLRVRAVNQDEPLLNRVNTATISIPLRTDANLTTYEFTLNAAAGDDDTGSSNTDPLAFVYARDEIYISRACSYKVNFLDLDVVLQDNNNPWIRNIVIQEDNVQNETVTHVLIYH